METRKMKKLGLDMPLLGMGLMRVPQKPDGVVEDLEATEMVDTMYKAGTRYFDTAYVYMDGESERFAKRALVDRYPRDSFYLATKLPLDFVHSPEDNDRLLTESLSRMGTDYVDFHLLHGIDYAKWQLALKMGSVDFQQEQIKKGRIKYAGFSFHSTVDDMRKILSEKSDWDFIQLQINYLDYYNDTAKQLYEIVSSYDIPIIVMEPVRGSALASIGDDIKEIFEKIRPGDSQARWAMRWVGSLPKVTVVLSGVSNIAQAKENSSVYSPLEPVTAEEDKAVLAVVDKISSRPSVPCTGCRYCCPCPVGVSIPDVFIAANHITRLFDANHASWRYNSLLNESQWGDKCVKCGACKPKCPQHIDIPNELERCHKLIVKAI